jgi:hypothetical protein
MSWQERWLRRWLKHSLLIFAGLGLGVAIGEIALRLAGYSVPSFYRRDPVIGATLRPNAEGWWTREGRTYIRINSRGLRDREHALAKPADTVRIAVLGDSFAEALQVPIERTFWAVAEAMLRDCRYLGKQDVEVINFGVSGYGPAQELLTLRQRVWDYDPDVVLLAVTTRNDVSDSSRALKLSDDIPYFTLANGQLVLDDSFRDVPAFRDQVSLSRRSAVWIRDHSRVAQAVVFSGALAARTWARGLDLDGGSGLASYRTPRNAVWQEAWAVTEALIGRIRDDVEARQKTFVVVTLSGPVQIDPDPQVRQAAMKKYGIDDFFYPDLRIRNFCERERIRVLTLAPPMRAFAETHRVQLHGSGRMAGRGHWNETGHRVAGEMIATWLCPTPGVSGGR